MLRSSAIAALCLALAAGGVSAQTAPPVGNASASGPVLQPGDALRITVWRIEELSGEFTVADAGFIVHPVYQEVHVAGVPIPQIEKMIRDLLLRYESEPQFVIEPLLRVVIGGEVRQPGLYSLPPGTTLAQAIVVAGGMTEQARTKSLRLLRAGVQSTVDFSRADAPALHTPIQSGDQILVARRSAFLRDYFWPIASAVGAMAGVLNVLRRW